MADPWPGQLLLAPGGTAPPVTGPADAAPVPDEPAQWPGRIIAQPPPPAAAAPPQEPNSNLAVAGNAALRGLTNLAGLPGSLQEGTEAGGAALYRAIAGEALPPRPEPPAWMGAVGRALAGPFSTERMQAGLRGAGILDRPGTEPQTTGQQFLAAAAEGAGAAPFGAVPALLGAVSGAGGEGTARLAGMFDWGRSPFAQAVARLAGNVAAPIAAGSALNAGGRLLNAARGRSGEAVAAFDRAGVTPRMVADVTDSPTAGRVTQAVRGMPGGGRVEQAARDTVDEFAAAVDRAAGMLGASPTPQRAGEALQTGARAWLRQWDQDSTAAWQEVHRVLRGGRTRAIATRDFLDNSQTALQSGNPALAQVFRDPTVQRIADAVRGQRSFTVDQLLEFRSGVGAILRNAPTRGDVDVGQVRQLYGAITRDLERLAAGRGPGAVATLNRANAVTRDGHALIESTVDNILGPRGRGRAPEEAFRWFVGQAGLGDTRLGAVEQAVGRPAFNAAAGTHLRTMAEPPPSAPGAAAGGPAASPGRFNTQFNRLSDEARALLFRDLNQPGGTNLAADLANIGGRFRATERFANTSQTAPTAYWQHYLTAAPAALGAAGGAAMGGAPGAAAGALAGMAGPPIAGALAGRAVTSPTLARVLAAPGAIDLTARQRALIGLLEQSNNEDLRALARGVPAGLLGP